MVDANAVNAAKITVESLIDLSSINQKHKNIKLLEIDGIMEIMTKAVIYSRYGAFAMALIATVGSLILSELLKLPPCVLCWYQRVFMYPLAFIIGVAILRGDKKLYQYILPLASIGWLIALYHSLLQWKIIPENVAPCVQGVSCTTLQLNLLGFITIPFMSLVAFSVIIGFMIIEWRKSSD